MPNCDSVNTVTTVAPTKAPTRTPIKQELVCPSTEGLFGACVEACSTKTDCKGDQMCCKNGCGHTCMSPVVKEIPSPMNRIADAKPATTEKQPVETTTTTTVPPRTTKRISSTTVHRTTQRRTTQQTTTATQRIEETTTKSDATEVPSSKTKTHVVLEPHNSREVKQFSKNNTAAASVNHDDTHKVTVSYLSSNGALVAAMCFGVLFLCAVCVLVGKRWYEGYQRRHYNKMDYLVNGMYN